MRPQRKINPAVSRKLARNRIVDGSNQTWETDVKYGWVAGEDRYFFMASIIDVYDRSIVGCHIGLRCESKDILRTLKIALKQRGVAGKELVLRSDNGPQFRGGKLREGCKALGVQQEFIPFKTPNLNAHIESFHSILEGECLASSWFWRLIQQWSATTLGKLQDR